MYFVKNEILYICFVPKSNMIDISSILASKIDFIFDFVVIEIEKGIEIGIYLQSGNMVLYASLYILYIYIMYTMYIV